MSKPQKKRRLGLSELTIIGLFVGIGCGLFFGEGCARFQILGDAFVDLLQMTVLLYIVLSLEHRFSNQEKSLIERETEVWGVCWCCCFGRSLL